MASVTIYTTPTCGYCKMTKTFLQGKNIDYKEIDVSSDQQAQQEMVVKSGQMGTPVIEVDGQVIVGFDQAKLSELLNLN